jgi:hypothetical protein
MYGRQPVQKDKLLLFFLSFPQGICCSAVPHQMALQAAEKVFPEGGGGFNHRIKSTKSRGFSPGGFKFLQS